MIRVLQVLGGLNLGGAETMIMNLYRRIDRTKIQFDFIIHLSGKQAYEDEVLSMGGIIYRFPEFNGKNLISQRRVWDSFFKEHPEYKIIHSHVRSYASIYLPIAKKYGLKTIIHSHSTSNGKGISSMVKAVMQYPLRFQADYYMACSDKAGKWLFGDRVIRTNKYMMVPNAIDAVKFEFNQTKREQVRHDLGVDNKYVIGHVGRLTEPKNHDFLIDVFYKMKANRNDLVLLLVGDGNLRNSIENKIEKLGINDSVVLVGSRSNTYDYYQAMDLFVFPSLWEGLGIAVIEAQAAGLYCVVSERIPEEVDIGADLIKTLNLSDGVTAWAHAINSIKIEHREGKFDLVKRAGFDISDNAKKIEEFYLKLV